MRTFGLELRSAGGAETIEGVISFVGEDQSGRFGIQAHHERFMTALVFGLARFRLHDRRWEYLALSGALLYFADNRLWLATRRYLRDSDYKRISGTLNTTLLAEEKKLQASHESLRRLEEAMLKRLRQMRQYL
ncbi:MAG: F0F1 ATP synthase subunit epsilon [Nitrococcus mobilis]|nr:F0F1 ATP synthase subunit epsilon [Nitrococcus mobilis]